MATIKKTAKKTAVKDKNIRETVTGQLMNALTDLKEQLGEKKFKKRVGKAAKKLVAGIGKDNEKKADKKKAAQKPKKLIPVKKKTGLPLKKKKA